VVAQRGERWRLRLETTVRRETRERVIEGDSCRAVGDAAALILAFLIDPKSAALHATENSVPAPPPADRSSLAAVAPEASPNTEPAPLQPAPPQGEPAPPMTTPDRSAAPRPSSSPPPARRWTLRALAGADSASLPSWSGFVNVGVGRAFGRGSIEVSGAYFAPRTRQFAGTGETRGGQFELFTLGARGCYGVLGPTFELSPCVGAEYGTVRGTAFGVGAPGVGKGLWLAATAAGAARWRMMPWLGTVAEVGLAVPLVRPEYVIDNVGVVYRADAVGLRMLAGLESYF
jgi:hypothetical protein